MTQWSYVRGSFPAILRANTLVMMAGPTADARARTLLETMDEHTPLEDILDTIVAGRISDAPDFFVGRIEAGSLIAFVRGSACVTLEDDRWSRSTTSGAFARTWRELAFDGVERMSIGFDGEAARADLRSRIEGERAAASGPLGATELIYRATEPALQQISFMAAPPEAKPLEFTEGNGQVETGPIATVAPAPEPDITPEPVAEPQPVIGPEPVVEPAPDLAPSPARAEFGVLRLHDGRAIRIEPHMIIGRSPRAERIAAAHLPTLVKLDAVPADISRNHARVTVDGGAVRVEDLGSSNGTLVIADDGSQHRLGQGESASIGGGSVIDLGGVRLAVEDAP